jgi:hypothetical protein
MTAVPGVTVTIAGSKDEAMIWTVLVTPFPAGAAVWTGAAGWEAGDGAGVKDEDGTVHPAMIRKQAARVRMRTEIFRIKDKMERG